MFEAHSPQESNNEHHNNEHHNNEHHNNDHSNNEHSSNYNPSPSVEGFGNLSEFGINTDLVLKSIFFGAIFYLLSLPEVYKMTAGCIGKKVDGVLVHSLVFAVLYYILTHFI
jgi:hypothetical protein